MTMTMMMTTMTMTTMKMVKENDDNNQDDEGIDRCMEEWQNGREQQTNTNMESMSWTEGYEHLYIE